MSTNKAKLNRLIAERHEMRKPWRDESRLFKRIAHLINDECNGATDIMIQRMGDYCDDDETDIITIGIVIRAKDSWGYAFYFNEEFDSELYAEMLEALRYDGK